MRLELIFELAEKTIPKDNKSIWISVIKNVLMKCNNGDFYDKFYANNAYKDFTYSVIYQKPRFVEDQICLGGNQVKLIFSSDDRNKTGLIFFSAFLHSKYQTFPLPDGNRMILYKCQDKNAHFLSNKYVQFL